LGDGQVSGLQEIDEKKFYKNFNASNKKARY